MNMLKRFVLRNKERLESYTSLSEKFYLHKTTKNKGNLIPMILLNYLIPNIDNFKINKLYQIDI